LLLSGLIFTNLYFVTKLISSGSGFQVSGSGFQVSGSGFQVSGSVFLETLNLGLGTLNPEPETRNIESGTLNPEPAFSASWRIRLAMPGSRKPD